MGFYMCARCYACVHTRNLGPAWNRLPPGVEIQPMPQPLLLSRRRGEADWQADRMMREKGGGDVDSSLSSLQSGRTPATDYYSLSGWQSHSPSARLDLDALPSRMLPTAPPLSKSPFSAAALARRPVLSPDRTYCSGLESCVDRDSAVYKRSSLTNPYRSSADLIYAGEQPPPPFPMPAYHCSKDASYLGLTSPENSVSSLYGRSVLENSLFNRSVSMASLPSNPNLVPNYRSHLGTSGEELGIERPLERKFVFGSSHSPSPLLSTHPYNRLLENYSQPTEHINSAVKSNLESCAGERTGTHYTSPLQSHAAFSTGSTYISRNPPLYPFGHLSSTLPPENYTSYASSLTHLSNYGQLSAPPPAHSRAHDVTAQRSSLAEEQSKRTVEGSVGQPFDATMSGDFTLPTSQWDNSSVSVPKTEDSIATFAAQAQSSDHLAPDRQCNCYQDSPGLPLPKEEDALEQLMGNQFVAVGSQEKVVSVPSQPCDQTSSPNPCQMDASWNMTDSRYTQSMPALPTISGNSSAQSPHGVDVIASDRCVRQPTTYSVNSSQHTASPFLPCQQSTVFPTRFTSTSSTANSSFTPSTTNPSVCQFAAQSSMYYSSNEGEGDSDQEESRRRPQTLCRDNRFVSITPNTQQQKEQSFPYTLSSKSTGNGFSGPDVIKTPGGVALEYDSSTSEYDPASPYQECVESMGEKPGVNARKPTITTSCQKKTGDVHVDMPSSKIKLTVRTERIMVKPGERVLVGPSKPGPTAVQRKRKKKGTAHRKEKKEGKRNNRTCPLCLKTFSRADSLTCHMRVHTGDRPYRCDQCDASYKVSSHLRDHIRSKHSNAKPFECEKCGKAFTYSTARRRHEKICGKDLADRVEYQCSSCFKGFVTAKGFSKHKEKCGNGNSQDGSFKAERTTYKCKNCRKVFDSIPSLDGHQRFFCGKTKNPQTGHFSCGECGKAFFKRNPYIIHMRHHAGGKPFRCMQCERCFLDKDSLKQHMEQHTRNMKFTCSMCDAAFFLKRCLSVHVRRVHGGVKPYKCKECAWEFSSGYHLCRHTRTVHHQVKRFSYVLVGNGFNGASFWMKRKRHHRFQPNRAVGAQNTRHFTCKFCSKSFSMEELHAHLSAEHPGATLSEAVSKAPVRCRLCSKDYSCQETLRVHTLQHKGKKPFRCPQCGVLFLLKSVLRLHQRKYEHYQPYSCSQCAKTFRWHASLRQHLATHHRHRVENGNEGSSKFTCNICGKNFGQQISLNDHMKCHRAVMPNICSECGKGFVDLRHLKLHMSKHQSSKSFVCEKCGAAFINQSRLQDHLKKRHTQRPKRVWLCDECGQSVGRRDSLQKHMALHAKYQNGLIPRKGPRKGTKPTKRREWRKHTYMHEQQNILQEDANSQFTVPTNAYGISEADLVELKPANFIPPSLGTSPSLGVIPNFAASRYGPVPGFVAPSSLAAQQQTQQQCNYHQYHYNTNMSSNLSSSTVANH